jgi:hypothetical protein
MNPPNVPFQTVEDLLETYLRMPTNASLGEESVGSNKSGGDGNDDDTSNGNGGHSGSAAAGIVAGH